MPNKILLLGTHPNEDGSYANPPGYLDIDNQTFAVIYNKFDNTAPSMIKYKYNNGGKNAQ